MSKPVGSGFGTKIRFFGERALFTRPEFKTERYSYEVMTPSAAVGMLESIFWHPGLKYKIDRIYVLKPIRYESIMKNEVKDKGNINDIIKMIETGEPAFYGANGAHNTQRNTTYLKNVDYVVEFHFDMTDRANETDNPGKFAQEIRGRALKGRCFTQPFFGTKDFSANFELWPEGKPIPTIHESKDLGFMLYDMDFEEEPIRPRFFHAEMENGIVQIAGKRVME